MPTAGYQRARRARLRAEGRCVECGLISAKYRCDDCYRDKYAKRRPAGAGPVRAYGRRLPPPDRCAYCGGPAHAHLVLTGSRSLVLARPRSPPVPEAGVGR